MKTMTSRLAVLAICAFGAAVASPAQSSAIFDFTDPQFGSGNQGTTHTYTFGTKELTVQAYSTILNPSSGGSGLPGTPANIRNNDNGLGVQGDGDTNQIDNGTDPVTGAGDEGVFEWLAFSTTTGTITGVDLHMLRNGEEADFWRATSPDGTPGTFNFLFTLNGVNMTDPQFAAVDLQGDPYLLVSVGNTETGFRVQSVHIPEPGTLAVFGLGLVGLGFARRRRAA